MTLAEFRQWLADYQANKRSGALTVLDYRRILAKLEEVNDARTSYKSDDVSQRPTFDKGKP